MDWGIGVLVVRVVGGRGAGPLIDIFAFRLLSLVWLRVVVVECRGSGCRKYSSRVVNVDTLDRGNRT